MREIMQSEQKTQCKQCVRHKISSRTDKCRGCCICAGNPCRQANSQQAHKSLGKQCAHNPLPCPASHAATLLRRQYDGFGKWCFAPCCLHRGCGACLLINRLIHNRKLSDNVVWVDVLQRPWPIHPRNIIGSFKKPVPSNP